MKTSRIELRVTPEEKDAWTRAADGQRLSEWLRDMANRFAEGNDPVLDICTDKVAKLKKITGQCPRWMHHRKGVYCGSCSQTA
jgi:hypothetical protein